MMLLALSSQYILPLASAIGVAGIGAAVTLYQVHAIGKRAAARDDYTALWGELRLRDGDSDRLRAQVTTLFEQAQQARIENIRLDSELATSRAENLKLTEELIHLRSQRGENDIDG